MHDQENKNIAQQCTELIEHIEQGCEWVRRHVSAAEGGEGAVDRLKYIRRKTRGLLRSASRRPAVALFGESQQGKSYLVSNLAKCPDESHFNVIIPGSGRAVDFIKEINPAGGEQESTGVVTRFSVAPRVKPGLEPIGLELLSQADLVKIIAAGFLSNVEKYHYEINPKTLRERVVRLGKQVSEEPRSGLNEDHIYEIKEYLNDKFNHHHLIRDLNKYEYWEELAVVAPHLGGDLRWELFQPLWGETGVLTDLFCTLSNALATLGFSDRVTCGMDALVPKSIQMYGDTVANTILDVQVLKEIVNPTSRPKLQVCLPNGQRLALDRPALSALTAELTLQIPEEVARHPSRAFLKDTDVLDFPGARSENKMRQDALMQDPLRVSEIFLRGKISYLFDTYNMGHEISALVFCQSHKIPNVMSIPKLIAEWVYRTHGKASADRINKPVSLFVAFTMFNLSLEGKPSDQDGDPHCHDHIWSARLKTNFHEHMKKPVAQDWPADWAKGEPFRNCFWIRDPKWSTHIFSSEAGVERAVNPRYIQKLKDMRTSFLNSKWSSLHFHDPERAWNEATGPGRSGMSYLVEQLGPVCNPQLKQDQLKSLFREQLSEARQVLEKFFRGGDQEKDLARAKQESMDVLRALLLMLKSRNGFGLFLHHLHITDEFGWKVLYDILNPVFTHEPGVDQHDSDDIAVQIDADNMAELFGFSLPESSPTVKEAKSFTTRTERFVDDLLEKWGRRLNELLGEPHLLERLGLPNETLAHIVNALETSMRRCDLRQTLIQRVENEVERGGHQPNIDLVARLAMLEINRFINCFGWGSVPERDRPHLGRNGPIFTQQPLPVTDVATLELHDGFPGERFFMDWGRGLQEAFVANVNYEYGGGIPNLEANTRLGALLNALEQ